MATQGSVSTRAKTLGVVLIVTIGLLNFHLPHVLLERATSGGAEACLELVFLALKDVQLPKPTTSASKMCAAGTPSRATRASIRHSRAPRCR
jgi:hypothetical protein